MEQNTSDLSKMMDPAEEEIEFASSKESIVEKDVDSAKPPLASTLPPATKHAEDAERFIQDAVEEGKLSEARYRKTLRDFALLEVESESLNLEQSSQPEVKSGLKANAELLDALHRAGESDSTDDKKGRVSIDKSELADADALRRLSIAGWVLQKAADLKKRQSTRSQMSKKSARLADGQKQSIQSSRNNNEANAIPDEEAGEGETIGTTSHHGHSPGLSAKARRAMHRATSAAVQEWSALHDFFEPKRPSFFREALFYLYAFLIPSLAVALIFFYAENTPTGRCEYNTFGIPSRGCLSTTASYSWWIIFIGARQTLIWILSRGMEVLIVDFFILEHPMVVRWLGPRVCLLAVQSKGWPSNLFWWGVWNAVLIYGDDAFNHHWLYWQDVFRMFNESNPSGQVTSADSLKSLIVIATVGSLFVVVKRHWLGIYLGSRLYTRFHERLYESLKEVLLISELSLWARRKRDQHRVYAQYLEEFEEDAVDASAILEASKDSEAVASSCSVESVQRESFVNPEELINFSKILDPWDEPKRSGKKQDVSGSQIVEFQQAFAVVTRPFFFSTAFGPAESRDECVKSSEMLFRRILKLLAEEDEETIDFYKICNWMYRGCHTPEEKANAAEYLKLFEATEDGKVYIVDFVVKIDQVYRKLRVLENAVNNASHVDKAYEQIINVFFGFVGFFVCLGLLGLDVVGILTGLSALLVSFGFMIGSGTSQLFEGVLMVLSRQPYDIGDRIGIALIDDPANRDGSMQWVVENIDLVSTTAKLAASGEVASFSNGTLARARLINATRSPCPQIFVTARFETDVPYSTIMIFRSAVEKFIDERPEEWVGMAGFRTTRVEAELNFVEYAIVLKHRKSWHNFVPVMESKATVASFVVEAMKQLGCSYKAPQMGVIISMEDATDTPNSGGVKEDDEFKRKKLMQLVDSFGASKKDS